MVKFVTGRSSFAVLVLLSGCGWVPKGDLRTLEVQNRTLSEQNRAQQAEIVNLREHQRKLENRLIRTESDVAAQKPVKQSGSR
jgi:hypothetical protein